MLMVLEISQFFVLFLLAAVHSEQLHALPEKGRQLQASPSESSTAYSTKQLAAYIASNVTEIFIGSSINLSRVLPSITNNVTIQGNASLCSQFPDNVCTIRGRFRQRHFTVENGGQLTVRNLVLRSGSSEQAGSILVTNGSSLFIETVTFSFNYASGVLKGGGAIGVELSSHAVITNSTFMRNVAGFGGAIDVAGNSTAAISNTLFHNNTAGVAGGAISFLVNSVGLISGGQISSNFGPIGGGVFATASTVQLCNVTSFRNTASVQGSTFLAINKGVLNYCGQLTTQFSTASGATIGATCSSCSS